MNKMWITFIACVSAFPAWSAGAGPSSTFNIWNCDVISDARNTTPPAKLEPMTIIGARNGVFSGKVIIESTGDIKGVKASVSALKTRGAIIPAKDIEVRYAVAFDGTWKRNKPPMLDILLESPPKSVAAVKNRALLPVWVTVRIPRDAKPGLYKGALRVAATGLSAKSVPIELSVADWTLPDPRNFRVWMGMIQSPDTLSLEYDVPMWSEKHWALIEQSFKQMKSLGCPNLFVPLLCGTNLGNAESMVRWIPKGDGTYDYDFSIMEKYMDLAEKHLGKPKQVVFHVWDVYMSPGAMKNVFKKNTSVIEGRKATAGKGPRVTVKDPKTGKLEVLYLPRYEDPACRPLWRKLFKQLRERMKKRGVEKAMTLGLLTDQTPSKTETITLQEVSGGLPWMMHAHPTRLRGKPATGNKLLHKIADITGEAHVYDLGYNVNPEKGRQYGWKRPELTLRFSRNGFSNYTNVLKMRLVPAFNITGTQRGLGRLGADTWYVLRDKRGRRGGAVYHRYPENNWRNLDIEGWVLAPGPKGPVGTTRLENLREGIEECEARIFIESVLLDPAKKATLGAALAERAQKLLDDRHRAMWRSTWDSDEELAGKGMVYARYPMEALWGSLVKSGKKLPGYWDSSARRLRRDQQRKGQLWFAASGWKQRNKELFDLAAEIQKKLVDSQ